MYYASREEAAAVSLRTKGVVDPLGATQLLNRSIHATCPTNYIACGLLRSVARSEPRALYRFLAEEAPSRV